MANNKNKNNHYKGGNRRNMSKINGKGKPRGRAEMMDKAENTPAYNDISWYSKFPNLLTAAAQFPYPYKPGMILPFGNAEDPASTHTARQIKIPGVMILDWIPSMGKCLNGTDPAAVAAKEIYAKVRKAYSGTISIDAPEYMVYLMCLDSLFAYIAALKRIYRLSVAWDADNYATPDALLRAIGLTPASIADIRNNRTQFWQYINQLILQSRKFACPAVMDIFNRHYWMSDNVYTDSPEKNAQFYMFNMAGAYKYAQVKMPDGEFAAGAVLSPTPWMAGKDVTHSTLYNFGLSMIQNLVAWDESYTISGYLMRAFEGTPSFFIDEIPQDAQFTADYDELVLAQIENSRCIPYGDKLFSFVSTETVNTNITQDVIQNIPYCAMKYRFNQTTGDPDKVMLHGSSNLPPMLNSRKTSPTVVDNTEMTRLLAGWDTELVQDGSDYYYVVTIDCGTEVPLAWRMVNTPNPTGSVFAHPIRQYFYMSTDSTLPAEANNSLVRILNLLHVERFDWHPFAWITLSTGSGADTAYGFNVSGDIHNVTVINQDDLTNLHTVCLYSEFNAFAIV